MNALHLYSDIIHIHTIHPFKVYNSGLPGGPVVESPPCNAGDMGLIPGQRTRSHML